MRASVAKGHVTSSVTIATQTLVTLIAIIIITDSYFDLTRASHWEPTILDTAVPYILGSSEVAVAAWVGDNTLWWAALSSLLVVSSLAFKYSLIQMRAEEPVDPVEHRRLMKVVRKDAVASLTTLVFSVAVCLLSIYKDLPVFYAIAPVIAAAIFISTSATMW